MTTYPLKYRWTGEAMVPLALTAAQRQFKPGQVCRLDVWEERSSASHNQYFAALAEGWANLPENLSECFPTVEHLRKYALIKCGYHDQRSIPVASKAEALRIAAFVRPLDPYAIVIVHEATVTIYTAQSQSMRAQGKAAFQDSKTKVLDFVSGLIGVSAGDLEREAGRAA